MHHYHIRTTEAKDNREIAAIIRLVLKEFGANKPGTVYFDPTTDDLYSLFSTPRSAYYVIESDGKLLGGCGIYPTEGLPSGYCELVKLYLLPQTRGLGLGSKLIEHCLTAAAELGYQHVYLESMPELAQAVSLYRKLGFSRLNEPLGNSGHFGCDIWMTRSLDQTGSS
ncbi:GNAT family N-acetyltransferase [Arcticibacter sp. MXS-1]|uniref:GNAT family N-acetyltransferase n=1 Tax=Arcticibacter sp. MXS-1 TaxID=3341726 RepID=UPI0035A86BEC